MLRLVCRVKHHSDDQLVTRGDREVAALAHAQHGVVSIAQLRAAGLGRGAVDLRVRHGRLHPVHRGVYAVGHARLTFRGCLWAAVLACGGPDAAVISHRSAAAVWDLLPAPGGPIDVTVLRRSGPRPGIHVHRSRSFDPVIDAVGQPDGLPTTTVARTLADLAAVLTPHRLGRVVHRAEHLRLLDATAVNAHVARAPRGANALRAAMNDLTARDPDITRSELEERFLAVVDDWALPRPKVNAAIGHHTVDFLWPEHRLVVEVDGRAAHATARAFERDRRRDAELQAAGYRVIRFTYRQVVDEPAYVTGILRAILAP
jgi:very-short-patch-repair endonuclease